VGGPGSDAQYDVAPDVPPGIGEASAEASEARRSGETGDGAVSPSGCVGNVTAPATDSNRSVTLKYKVTDIVHKPLPGMTVNVCDRTDPCPHARRDRASQDNCPHARRDRASEDRRRRSAATVMGMDDGKPRVCVDCGATAPSTETAYTLISSRFGWRLQYEKSPAGEREARWRCGECWKRRKGKPQGAMP
jgi:hypothetical protein